MQAHTNADDATRYRNDADVQAWVHRDPLTRVETYLRGRGLLDDAKAADLAEAAEVVATRVRDGLNTDVEPDHRKLFDHVYARRTPQLEEQAALVADELSRETATEDAR
jgi:pyruvate dehydrogenase E1 component alpha subunit